MESLANQSINSIPMDELLLVKGMNTKLAERIIAGRPYEDFAALKSIKGMKLATYQELEKRLEADGGTPQEAHGDVVEVVHEPTPVEPQMVVEPAQILPVQKPVEALPPEPEVGKASSDVGPQPEKPGKRERSSVPGRLELYLVAGAGLFLGVVLSLALSLGILYMVNNTLVFASASQVTSMQSSLQQAQSDLKAIQERVSAIEDLSGRVAGLEQQTKALGKDLDAANQDLARLDTAVSSIQQRARVFDTFLAGLRSLLDSLPSQDTGQ